MIIIGKEEFQNVFYLNDQNTDDVIYRMKDDLDVSDFRWMWEFVFDKLLREFFSHFAGSYNKSNMGIGVILRAGTAGLLAAKDWILEKGLPVFLIWTARNEKSENKDISADMLSCNLPKNAIPDMRVVILEPMCATAVSAKQTIEYLKRHNIKEKNINFLFGVSAPHGLMSIRDNYPEVKIITAYTSENIGLNDDNYIIYLDTGKQVVGDAGDRWMGITSNGELLY